MSSEQLAAARDALARGDVLVAYDLAVGASRGDPTDLEARYVVGSSRVDLQACKLEYSIVSPK